MSGPSYRVLVLPDFEAWSAWLRAVPAAPDENPHTARVRHIEATGETVLHYAADGFIWICPGCGMAAMGRLGEQPVSGWDDPCWVNSGTAERPTLTPSLGCRTWKRGDCPGHWWLRDGTLTPA